MNNNSNNNLNLINFYASSKPVIHQNETNNQEKINSLNQNLFNPNPFNLNVLLNKEKKLRDNEINIKQELLKKSFDNENQTRAIVGKRMNNFIFLEVEKFKEKIDYFNCQYNIELKKILEKFKINSCQDILQNLNQIEKINNGILCIDNERSQNKNEYLKKNINKIKNRLNREYEKSNYYNMKQINDYSKFKSFQKEIINKFEVNQKLFNNEIQRIENLIIEKVKYTNSNESKGLIHNNSYKNEYNQNINNIKKFTKK